MPTKDIWPNGGDYDLNDVIIEHKRAISFNSNNYVLKVEDTFVPVQKKWCRHILQRICRAICGQPARQHRTACRSSR